MRGEKWWKNWNDLSQLARIEMARLEGQGLTNLDPVSEDAPQGADEQLGEQSLPPKTFPVRLDKNQIIWVQPHSTDINNFGYRSIEVFGEPPRSDFAIVAALTALHTFVISAPEAVRKILPFIERWKEERSRLGDLPSVHELDDFEGANLLHTILQEPEFRGHEETATLGLDPRTQVHLEYLKDLLRHYRPGFDELPPEEQIAHIEHTSRYVNGFWDALRKLMEFVEHGTAKGDISPAVKSAARDVRVAELHDVLGLTYLKIAERIGEADQEAGTVRKDHPKVRKMGKRGRGILERAFGKEGWKNKIAAMKEEAERWRSLSEGQKWVERMSAIGAGFPGVLLEEARSRTWSSVDKKAVEQGVTREEAARSWAERYTPKILTELLKEDESD